MRPEHPSQGQKRKWQEEGGDRVGAEEPGKARKRVRQEQEDLELLFEEPSKGHTWKPQKEALKHLKPGECPRGAQEEGVTEVKSVDGGKGRKRPHCVLEETVEKHQNKNQRRLVEPLHPNSEPHGAHTSPKDTLKIKGCVQGQILGSKTTWFNPKQSASVATREHLPSDKCSETILDTQNPPATDLQIDGGRGRRTALLEGAEAQLCLRTGNNGPLTTTTSVLETEEDAPAGRAKGRATDVLLDVTDDMEKEISDALGPGPPGEILSSAFKLHITRGDIRTLKDTAWLNDEIINFYMNLIMERSENQGCPALHAFNTFFYTKLKQGGHSAVRRWTRGVDLFTKDLILVPIHLQVHWSLVAIDLRKKTIVYLDSMGQKGQNTTEIIFHYLQMESKTRRNIDLNPLEWKCYSMAAEEIPQQRNGSDCGVFTCKYADYISREQPITFSQQHMPLFRRKMVWEILHKHLL